MFSKKEVNRALTWMFCLYDIADVEIMGTDFDTVPEVVDALTPDILARKYKKEAQKLNAFRVSTGPEDEGSYCGEELFPQKAVFICAVDCQKVATDRIRIESESELWLLSNMKFAHVHCTRILTINGEEVTSVTECRNFVGIIKGKEDLFVDAQTLFEVLDDAGMFEALIREKEKQDEQDK